MDFSESAKDYQKVEAAIYFIGNNFSSRPGPDEIADNIDLSKAQFIQLIKRWAGVTPLQFLQFLAPEYGRRQLALSQSLLNSTSAKELSGPRYRHDNLMTIITTPSEEYKKSVKGVIVEYGYTDTPFGQCLLGNTDRGIAFLGFVDNHQPAKALEQLQTGWPRASFSKNESHSKKIARKIFGPPQKSSSSLLHLHLQGTHFQLRVWRALLHIPAGNLVCYQDIAKLIGQPNACRAVARAIAQNPIAGLIPCHRIITKAGKIHHYRWNPARKKALLVHEAAAVKQGRRSSF